MNRETYHDGDIVRILRATRTIAIIGASPDPMRHSHRVLAYMRHQGFTVYPVNPAVAGREIFGVTAVGSLADIPAPIDMVDVFRRQDAIPGVVDEVVSLRREKNIRFLWLQLDLYDAAAARKAREVGIEVVMDRCLKIEHGRLMSHRA